MQEMHNNFQEGEDWDVPPVSFDSFQHWPVIWKKKRKKEMI
jgi:hypothetical protein